MLSQKSRYMIYRQNGGIMPFDQLRLVYDRPKWIVWVGIAVLVLCVAAIIYNKINA